MPTDLDPEPMDTRSTRLTRHLDAPRAVVYRALLDARAIARHLARRQPARLEPVARQAGALRHRALTRGWIRSPGPCQRPAPSRDL